MTISTSSLVYETYVDTADMSRDIYVLKAMPLTVTVVGAGDGGTTTVAIERAAAYHMDRPDETTFNGYEGETIALASQVGEAQMTIDLNNLIKMANSIWKWRFCSSPTTQIMVSGS